MNQILRNLVMAIVVTAAILVVLFFAALIATTQGPLWALFLLFGGVYYFVHKMSK